MTAINVTPELKDIPVGIYGKDASPVELSFKLSGDMQNVTLVDKQSGKVYPVTDGLTLTVSGNTSGRYFLNGLDRYVERGDRSQRDCMLCQWKRSDCGFIG